MDHTTTFLTLKVLKCLCQDCKQRNGVGFLAILFIYSMKDLAHISINKCERDINPADSLVKSTRCVTHSNCTQ